ncbi:MAG: RidA family protein [Alphaproteobacteria bacterium]|nr:RidA family protein [Alphaproteobacteria bacterium]TAD88676.1 MAG: RidA family protein [Alphaproteobacteria bacterium]
MAGMTEARLQELGLELPSAPAPAASYVPTVITGSLLFTAGQVPVKDGQRLFVGKVGATMDVATAQEAAKLCALNILAQVKAAIGDLDRVRRCVKVLGFVNATPEFGEHPAVINGASDLLVAVLGERGRHARSAVGAGSLPFGVAVEVEAIFEIE